VTPPAAEDGQLAALVVIIDELAAAVGTHDRRLRKVERTALRPSPAAARRRRAQRLRRVVAGSRRPVAPPDPEAVAVELAAWVDWLRATYRLPEALPQSWQTDPGAVAELAALYRAWQAADAPAAAATEQLSWHDGLARVTDRLIRRQAAAPDSATDELVEWVDWLREHYRLDDRLPEGWQTEPAILAELAALRRAWQAAFRPAAGGADAVHWHDALVRVLERLESWQAAVRRRRATVGRN
jgi:hypothetical protein